MSSQGDTPNPPPVRKKKKKIHRHRDSKVKAGSIRSDINVTPLVDVVLVLLIIFMVVTPMITRGKPVEQPITKYHDKKSDSGQQIVVSVTCEGGKMGAIHWECAGSKVFVAAEQATDDTIADLIQKEVRKKSTPEARDIYVKADKKLNYSVVRNVMERIHNAGVSTIELGSDELKKD